MYTYYNSHTLHKTLTNPPTHTHPNTVQLTSTTSPNSIHAHSTHPSIQLTPTPLNNITHTTSFKFGCTQFRTQRTFKDTSAETHALRCNSAELVQYLYINDSDETPSTIHRKDKACEREKKQRSSKVLAVHLGPKMKCTTSMTQTQSKILQSSQKYSMLFRLTNGEFKVLTSETMNWLQLVEKTFVAPPS